VKRAPAGSGQAPVASGTGAEAPAAAGYVGAAPVASGFVGVASMASCSGCASGREGRSSGTGCAWAVVPGGGGGGVTAAAAAWVHMAARVRMKRCALGRRRLKLLISDGAQEAVGHKLMSDGC
jgi:hypothetical protein